MLATLGGVKGTHIFVSTKDNPQHGERADGQSIADAQKQAGDFMHSKIADAASKALKGDAEGALKDLGQASHTAQDIVRHQFESASEHGWSEAPATKAEMDAAVKATQDILKQFEAEVQKQAGGDTNKANQAIENVKNDKKTDGNN